MGSPGGEAAGRRAGALQAAHARPPPGNMMLPPQPPPTHSPHLRKRTVDRPMKVAGPTSAAQKCFWQKVSCQAARFSSSVSNSSPSRLQGQGRLWQRSVGNGGFGKRHMPAAARETAPAGALPSTLASKLAKHAAHLCRLRCPAGATTTTPPAHSWLPSTSVVGAPKPARYSRPRWKQSRLPGRNL